MNEIDYGIISGSTYSRRYEPVLKSKYMVRKQVDINGKQIPQKQLQLLNYIASEVEVV